MLKVTLRGFLAHKGRLMMSMLAVTLSVAFVAGTLIFGDTITRMSRALAASTAADLTVTSTPSPDDEDADRAPLPGGVVQKMRTVDGVRAVHPVVESERLLVVDRHNRKVEAIPGALPLGRNWLPAERSGMRLAGGHEPRGAGEVVIDADSADHSGITLDDPLRVSVTGGSFDVTVVGIAAFTSVSPGVTVVFFDTATAQDRLLGTAGGFSSVEIDAASGVDLDDLKRRVEAALGHGVTVATRAEVAGSAAADLGSSVLFFTMAMLGFAAMALLVAMFLIFNTFAMLTAARTREIGMLRAVGASRGQVSRSVLVEALLLGLISSTLGLGVGAGLAVGLIAALDVLGAGRELAPLLEPRTAIAAYVIGIGVTVISAYLPARRAARITPMAALRDAGTPTRHTRRVRTVAGAVLMVVGATGLGVAVVRGSGGALAIGIVASLPAFVVLGPVLTRLVIPVLAGPYPRWFGVVGQLSRDNALRNPRRTGATAAALMIGVAVVGCVAVVASSMDSAVQRQIDRALGADYVVSTTDLAEPPLPAEAAGLVRRVPGVARVIRTKVTDVAVTSGGSTENTWLLGIEPDAATMSPVRYARGSAEQALAPGRIAVGSDYAKEHGLSLGDEITLRTRDGHSAVLTIAALLAEDKNPAAGRRKEKIGDSSRHGSRPTVGLLTLDQLAPGTPDDSLRVELSESADPEATATALRNALVGHPQAQVRGQAEYKALAGGQLDVLLFLVYGLLALTIIIAILGVVNTLALSVVERIAEIGLLRAVGATRTQIRDMIRLESTVIAVYGAVLGLVLGLVWGVAAQRVLAAEGVEVLTVPWATIAAMLSGSAVVGLLAAMVPARRAARMNVLSAIGAG
ncbi:MAG TPA: FtsX-like permease family protein [Actinoplanes sp.]|jgi:putative ABC transport system permease protein